MLNEIDRWGEIEPKLEMARRLASGYNPWADYLIGGREYPGRWDGMVGDRSLTDLFLDSAGSPPTVFCPFDSARWLEESLRPLDSGAVLISLGLGDCAWFRGIASERTWQLKGDFWGMGWLFAVREILEKHDRKGFDLIICDPRVGGWNTNSFESLGGLGLELSVLLTRVLYRLLDPSKGVLFVGCSFEERFWEPFSDWMKLAGRQPGITVVQRGTKVAIVRKEGSPEDFPFPPRTEP